ncbi:MAG: ATP-binding protein [Anaerolineae bacterium]|nr:ATP-binding protein [Anaerolineae bacterium]
MAADLQRQRIDSDGGAIIGGNLQVGRDFIGRDQNLYYIFQGMPGLAARPSRPYVADRAFQVTEHLLFTGREEEIERALSQMEDPGKRAIVIYGPADAGKTSLLTAGILPRLDRFPQTTEVYPLRAFGQGSSDLHRLLLGSASRSGLDLPAETPVPELASAITKASGWRLLVILDQFERFFQPDVSAQERDALRNDLCGAIEAAGPRLFQIVIAIRDDMQSDLDRQWGDLLPGLRQSPIYVQPLSLDQARQAIQHPLQELALQPVFDEAFLEGQLLADLDYLSFDQPGSILPADLQVVCSQLWQTAKDRKRSTIDTALYWQLTDGKGAEQVMDLRFDGLLARIKAERRDLARQITTAMLDRGPQAWLVPEQMSSQGSNADEIQATLEEMSTAEMVIWHVSGGQLAYALASASIARAADRALGREAQKRRQARWELEYAWRDWVSDDSLAGRYQLNLIRRDYVDGPPPPERGLLLLASAVARQAPVDHWLAQLDTGAAQMLIRALEEGEAHAGQGTTAYAQSTAYNQASRLLAIADDEDLPAQPPSAGLGPLAWAAAGHRRKAACRETAALALLAAYGPDALERVEAAVRSGRLGRRRLAELRGILADASSGVAAKLRERPPRDRLEAWWWRFRRRLIRDLPYVASLTLGGAVGAGLGLGLLRALLAPLVQEKSGYWFYAASATGFLFGLAVSLGLLLVDPIRLQPRERGPESTRSRPLLPGVVLGALCFAAMHVLHLLLFGARGLAAAALISALALPAGAGLSLAVYDQPFAGQRLGAGRWLLRLAAAAAALALVQAVFSFALDPGYGTGLVFAWTGYFYQSGLNDTLVRWGLQGILAMPHWFDYAAVIDGGLTGVALSAGLAVGLNVAGRWFAKWEALADQAGA